MKSYISLFCNMKAQKQQKYSPPRLLEIFKSPFKNPQKNTKLWVHFQTLEQDSRNVGFKPHDKKSKRRKSLKLIDAIAMPPLLSSPRFYPSLTSQNSHFCHFFPSLKFLTTKTKTLIPTSIITMSISTSSSSSSSSSLPKEDLHNENLRIFFLNNNKY